MVSKILIVDDEKNNRVVTRLALTPAGYQFWEAANGAEALRLAAEIHPDIVLLDVNMPVMDGLEVCRRMKADPALVSIFVIIVSGSRVDTDSQIIGLESGADDYLTTPISSRELLARVKAMLRIHAAERVLREKEIELRDLIANNVDGMLVVDEAGLGLFANPAACELLGLPADGLVGHPLHISLEAGEPVEMPVEAADGKTIFVERHARRIEWRGQPAWLVTLHDITWRKQIQTELDVLRQFQSGLVETISEGISVTDMHGTITFFNPAGAAMLGYTPQELVGKPQSAILQAEEIERVQAIDRQRAQGVSSRYELNLRCKDGSLLPVQVSGSPRYRDEQMIGTLAVFADIRQIKETQKFLEVRLGLMEFASSHSIDEILQKTLDEVGQLVQSPIGFYHFVEPDQQTLSLQTWSTRTLQEYCTAEGAGQHYSIHQAGVWVDCVQQRQPVIHNDYAALPHRKGLPAGHAPLVRELVVPILRQGLVVAILGVGNKASEYTAQDIDIVTYFADVTWEIVELRRTQQALQSSEKQYRQLFDQSISAFALHEIICNEAGQVVDYRFLSVNAAFEAMTGLQGSAIIGRTVLEILPASDQMTIERYGRVAQTGQPDEFEAFSQDLGKYYEIRAYSPEKDRFATLFQDITERKRTQQQLASHTENLEAVVAARTKELGAAQEKILRQERLSLLGQLAGSVGHELRTPLGVINNAIYLLKLLQPDANEKVKEYHALIKEEINKADRIISDLLDFARIKSISKEAVNVPVLIGKVLERFPVSEPVQVTLELPAGLPPVHADPRQLEQVLGNLVVNACQAMPTGGKLKLSAAQQVEEIAIAVQDSGLGIAPENLPRLFEPLFTTKPKGIGLGLSVCKKLIEANDGRIELQSEVGKGTIFTIYLPLYAK